MAKVSAQGAKFSLTAKLGVVSALVLGPSPIFSKIGFISERSFTGRPFTRESTSPLLVERHSRQCRQSCRLAPLLGGFASRVRQLFSRVAFSTTAATE